MKNAYRFSGKISLLFYIFILYQIWHLCQYGGVRSHLPMALAGAAGFFISFAFWLISRRKRQDESVESSPKRQVFCAELIIFIIATLYFGGRIVYSGIPYNGALSWKIEEWRQKEEVKLEHNNFFEDGVEGILTDLDEALDLPDELYVVNEYQMTFDKEGRIRSISTFLYGQKENGERETYLVDYNADKDENMTVWVNGEANITFEEDKRLKPMLTILEAADCEQQVKAWSVSQESATYEILYYGRRAFASSAGLQYLPGDADGDGDVNGINNFAQLMAGGEVVGFEVSLYIPEAEVVTPVRYIMEPEYISQEALDEERETQQVADSKDSELWTVDQSDGTMYFFLDDSNGWRLVVADAAAGSRYYQLEKTKDGGTAWEKANADPFAGALGVTEGLVFFDENFGFAGLTGASQSASQLYITTDGGATFRRLELPMDTVTDLPETAAEYGFTIDDYDYFYMPEKEGGILTIQAVTEAAETEGILFQSSDGGETWTYVETNIG